MKLNPSVIKEKYLTTRKYHKKTTIYGNHLNVRISRYTHSQKEEEEEEQYPIKRKKGKVPNHEDYFTRHRGNKKENGHPHQRKRIGSRDT